MTSNLTMKFSVDKENKKVNVQRTFAAPVSNVWAAWTEPELLDQWWAPKPWKAETKSMNFTVGGRWLYAMVGPDGTKHWSYADYKSITPLKNYSEKDGFCDENGNANDAMPRSEWTVTFNENGANSTVVNIEITHEKLSDLEAILAMGFKEGFTAGMDNLDELIANKTV